MLKLQPNTTFFKWKDIILLLICMLCGLLFSMLLMTTLVYFDFLPAAPDLNRIETDGVFTHLHAIIFLNHIGMFILPALVYILIRNKGVNIALGIHKMPKLRPILIGISAILASLFFVFYIYEWNKSLPLPDWAVSFEQDSEEKIKALLSKPGFLAFLINLTVVAVIPAIGEELIFRGVIQNTLISTTRKPWMSILITATIFSAFHLMFEGFFARLFLGILLGYLYVVSKNIWLPILAHFANNAFQITMDFIGKLMNIEVSDLTEFKVHWSLAIASLLLTIFLCHYLYVFFRRQNPVQESETSLTSDKN
jgi:uncharacterized protein